MKTHRAPESTDPHRSAAFWGRGLLVAVALCFAGCGKSATSAEGRANQPPLEADDTAASNPAEAKILAPAQVSDAAEALDLSRVALLPGVEKPAERMVTSLVYGAPGTPEDAFKFHREQLTTAGWKELPGSAVTPQYASAVFAKRGLHLSLTAHPDQPGKVGVALHHHGNISFSKLPVPSGAKAIYAGPSSAIFAVALPVEAAASETAAALTQIGWEPYGAAAPTQWFKQNAVKLSVMTVAAPAQDGKTTINFSSEMLPMDVPVPASAMDVQFASVQKRLTFRVGLSHEECFAFYRASLGKKGWQSTTEAPSKNGATQVLILRNTAKDILRLEMRAGPDGQLLGSAELLTAAEIEEMNRKMDAQAEAHKAAKAAAAAER